MSRSGGSDIYMRFYESCYEDGNSTQKERNKKEGLALSKRKRKREILYLKSVSRGDGNVNQKIFCLFLVTNLGGQIFFFIYKVNL